MICVYLEKDLRVTNRHLAGFFPASPGCWSRRHVSGARGVYADDSSLMSSWKCFISHAAQYCRVLSCFIFSRQKLTTPCESYMKQKPMTAPQWFGNWMLSGKAVSFHTRQMKALTAPPGLSAFRSGQSQRKQTPKSPFRRASLHESVCMVSSLTGRENLCFAK